MLGLSIWALRAVAPKRKRRPEIILFLWCFESFPSWPCLATRFRSRCAALQGVVQLRKWFHKRSERPRQRTQPVQSHPPTGRSKRTVAPKRTLAPNISPSPSAEPSSRNTCFQGQLMHRCRSLKSQSLVRPWHLATPLHRCVILRVRHLLP